MSALPGPGQQTKSAKQVPRNFIVVSANRVGDEATIAASHFGCEEISQYLCMT